MPDVCPEALSQYTYNDSEYFRYSRQGKVCTKQNSPVKQETGNTTKRRPKVDEQKLDSKRCDGNDSFVRLIDHSLHTTLNERTASRTDRSNKATNRKPKEVPKTPTFKVTLSDFPKLGSLGSNDSLDVQKNNWEPLCSSERDGTFLKQPGRSQVSALSTTVEETSAKSTSVTKSAIRKEAETLLFPSDTRVFLQAAAGSSTPTPLSWATVLLQAPKKAVSTPSSVFPSSKRKDDVQANSKPETRNVASELPEPEETSEKKKKKIKKKKKTKSNPELEKPQTESVIVQDPPRIEDVEEFPDLVAASDRRKRMGIQKFSYTLPGTGKQPEVQLTKEPVLESKEGYFQRDSAAPKQDVPAARKTEKQTSSATVEKKKTQEPSKNSGKKSQIPVQLDLGGMLAVLEQKQHAEKSKQSKPVVLSVGGAITLLLKERTTVTKNQQLNKGKTPHNPLDSSAPLVKKGKQREVPKAKKPTSLKKIILKEREQRKQQHLLEQMATSKCGETICQCEESTDNVHSVTPDTKEEVADDEPVTSTAVTQSDSEVILEHGELQDSMESSPSPKLPDSNLPKIHSRRFRDYCSQVLSKEVDSCVTDLLKELVRFQDRLYQEDPIKAKTKRRLVMGLREVLKHLKLKKLKCIIISPNCEKIQSKGGLDDTLHSIIDCACEQNVPFVFALNRKALGRCMNKAVPVSVVGIFSYDGAQDHFHKMIELTVEARQAYKDMIAALEREAGEEGSEEHSAQLTTEHESNLPDTNKAAHTKSDEEVPNYIKIWRRKLEEEYSPYALELEKQAVTKMLSSDLEDHR
uniref:SECIS binding protein 2 n=1 Tax=Sphenodon punctatus TaxID=8508 RepID=A0A8D0GX89_SPHPU